MKSLNPHLHLGQRLARRLLHGRHRDQRRHRRYQVIVDRAARGHQGDSARRHRRAPDGVGLLNSVEQLPKLADLVARALAEARARGRCTGALPAITVFEQPKVAQ